MNANNKVVIFLDSCAWNILFQNNVNLATEFPFDQIEFAVTKEVLSFEVDAIPESKKNLKEYIYNQIDMAAVREDSFFGFSSYNDPPDYKSRVGGFNEGRFATCEELIQVEKYKHSKNKLMKTGLYKDEADASLAVRAATGGIVLTAEDPNKSGPLKLARLEGNQVIDIRDFDSTKKTFRNYINEKLDFICSN